MSVVIAVLAFFVFIASFFIPSDFKELKIPALIGSFLVMVLATVWSGYYSVPAGHRGILLQFGAVKGELTEGAHYVTPFVQSVSLIEVRTLKEESTAAAASKDLQTVKTVVAINYHPDPVAVGDLYKKVGNNYSARIIEPATQETVKAVVANYTAEELIRLRSKVKSEMDESLRARLASYNIVLESVSITNFDFSPEFNAAIEAKQTAQQVAEQQKYVLQKAKLEAETAVTNARGEAEANRIKAQALNAQGGGKVLAREWIEKWDGHLPTVQSGSGMIIDVRSLMQEAK